MKRNLDEDMELNSKVMKKYRFWFIILLRKLKNALHFHIHIYCRLNKIHNQTFTGRFENFIFVLSAQTDSQYYSSSFFFVARPVLEITCRVLDRPVEKIISHLPVRPVAVQTFSLNVVSHKKESFSYEHFSMWKSLLPT